MSLGSEDSEENSYNDALQYRILPFASTFLSNSMARRFSLLIVCILALIVCNVYAFPAPGSCLSATGTCMEETGRLLQHTGHAVKTVGDLIQAAQNGTNKAE
jgi:hypothetical protein